MKIPVIHERVQIVQKAEGDFQNRLATINKSNGIRIDQAISIYAGIIANLQSYCECKSNPYMGQVEALLSEVSSAYNLTYGEKVKVLSSLIQNEVKYAIRWERHGTFEKEGDWA